MRVGDGQRAQLARLDVRQQRGQVADNHRHGAPHHIVQPLGRALVGHMQKIGTRLLPEQLACQVQAAAHPG
ncbi:hypothetical protein D3C71_1746680 [compost metagenome]